MDLEEIRQDIAAFADNEEDVIIDRNTVVFQRNRDTYHCVFIETSAGVIVEFNGSRIPYRKFLGEELGRMSVLAEAIKQKRQDVDPYIDTKSLLTDSVNNSKGPLSALDLLWEECTTRPVGETKLIFLTADAGHGKTALLRRLTQKFATAYGTGHTDMLLLHIDTQGRSFLRLEEAVARDLGQLRIAGVYYSGIIRLIKGGLLAIAIDGFDELLAEVGFGEAYSGLGAFLRQLDGTGVVVASARSAYFEVENYAAQTRLLASLPGTHVAVQQMRLARWERPEAVKLFREYRSPEGARISEPDSIYDELAARLPVDHPVLHRPFLVFQMASLISSSSKTASQIAEELAGTPIEVVPRVIAALLRREVEEKWRDPSGQPYLSLSEHLYLLSALADEMWTQGKNSLAVDLIQLITEAVMDELKIPAARRVPISQRVKAHALLVASGNSADLAFDHEEFFNYFLAERVAQLTRTKDNFGLQRFLELHALPPIVALWTVAIGPWSDDAVSGVIERLGALARAEMRSTYLKQNVGLLAARLSERRDHDAPFVFDSMYFEGDCWKASCLDRAEFIKCTFINVDLTNCEWSDCNFTDCRIDGLTCSPQTSLKNCVFRGSSYAQGVLLKNDGELSELRNYIPEECTDMLERLGARFEVAPTVKRSLIPVPEEHQKALDAFFRIFSRNSGATEEVMKLKLGKRYSTFVNIVLPLLIRHNVVQPTEYRGRGQQSRYELNFPLESILMAEDPEAPTPKNLRDFWAELREQ
jgi:hypothetical protein